MNRFGALALAVGLVAVACAEGGGSAPDVVLTADGTPDLDAPEAAQETGPDAAPDAAPDAVPDAVPEVPAEVAPDEGGEMPQGPCLALVPGDLVDFGFVAAAIAVERAVTIRNDCAASMEVLSVTVTDDAAGAFSIAEGGAAGTLDPDATRVVRVRFENKGIQGEATARLVVLTAAEQAGVDLRAHGVEPPPPDEVRADPPAVAFGDVTVGCGEPEVSQVCLRLQEGPAHAVDDVDLAPGCTPEVELAAIPPLPAVVGVSQPLCFEVRYAPRDEGADTCQVVVSTGGDTLAVPVSGSGAFASETSDEFVQLSGTPVDVLFVIDDSGSMCDDHGRLVDGFQGFLSGSGAGVPDYHVGVVSVDAATASIAGRLNLGNGAISPRFVTPDVPDPAAAFAAIMGAFTCSGSGEEAGLAAMKLALSAPLAAAGGWNEGFLRPGALLEVVVFSDEDDQSPGTAESYAAFLADLKGGAKVAHMNAIVGPPGGCADPILADPGLRYIQAAQQTGGAFRSFCEADLAPLFDGIETEVFGLPVQFYLSGAPVPGTIRVTVAGAPCESGWEYDAPTNSVVFDRDGPCFPQPGQAFEVSYATQCAD